MYTNEYKKLDTNKYPNIFVYNNMFKYSNTFVILCSGPSRSVRGPWDVMYFLKVMTNSFHIWIFSKVYFPKCIFQSVFSKVYFPKCFFQSVFFQSAFFQSAFFKVYPVYIAYSLVGLVWPNTEELTVVQV